MSAADERARQIAECPTPVYHETHRYCPSCPWTEPFKGFGEPPVPDPPVVVESRADFEREFGGHPQGPGSRAVTRLEKAAEAATMESRLAEVMNRFPEVVWDRYAISGGFGAVYGWIERPPSEKAVERVARYLAGDLEDPERYEQDARRMLELGEPRADFLVLEVYEGHVHGFSTSSAALSETFGERLGFVGDGHVPCLRVEDGMPGVERKVELG